MALATDGDVTVYKTTQAAGILDFASPQTANLFFSSLWTRLSIIFSLYPLKSACT